MRAALIINPQAGNGGENGQTVSAAARARGITVIPTRKPTDVRPAIRKAVKRGLDVLLVGGGDGTINQAAGTLAEFDDPPALGVIPLGTANDFATGCALPLQAEQTLAGLEHRHTRPLDLVRVTRPRRKTPRYLVNAATAGISAQIAELLEDEDTKHWWGKFAYARVAVELMPTAQVYELRLTIDGARLDAEASALLVCNGPRAGGVTLIPPADPGDGRLDIAILTTNDAVARAALLARFALGTHLDSPDLIHRRCTRLEVRSQPPLHFVGDGEKLGPAPITFELLPAKLRLLCGA